MKELEERVAQLEMWRYDTRRLEDPSIMCMDRHISTHNQDWEAIKELREEVSILIKEVKEIKASLIALCSAREVHNLIEELKE